MKNLSIYCLSILMASPLCLYAQTEDTEYEEEDTVAVAVVHKTQKQEKTRTIRGCVIAQKDKQPLAGVLVQSIAGEGYSTLSEEDGTFEMQVPTYSSAVTVTIPGFNMIRVGLNRSGELGTIYMQSEASRALYGADDNINNVVATDDMEFTSARNVTTEVGSQLGATVYTRARSGAIAQGNYMSIGGVNSLQSNTQPLIVLDGVILDQQYSRTMLHSGYYNDMLTNINPADVKSVEVLTNGTALYGAKGANGVILINTKRNTSQATRIEASVNMGVELVPKMYDMMSGSQYKTYASALMQSTGTTATSFKFLNADPTYYWYNKYNNNTNWADHVYSEALLQNYSLSVQGGGDVAGYMLSVGYTKDNSVLDENNFNRLNIRFNTDIQITKNLSMRFDAAYTNQTRKLLDTGAPESYDNKSITSTTFLAMAKSPMLSPYSFANGVINKNHLDIDDEDYLDEISSLSSANYRLANPMAISEYGTAENKNYFDNSYVNIAVTPKYQINKHLFVSEMFSYSSINTNEKYYVPLNGVPSYYVSELQGTMENEIGSQYGKQNSVNSDTKIDWRNSYKGHNIHLQGGFRFINESYSLNTQHGYNTGNDKTPFIDNADNKTSSGSSESWATMTWYGQAEYNWANRYYLEGDLAVETNSQFGREAKGGFKCAGVVWGVFPSIQAGWVASNEKFFNVPGVDYLKFTAGYGVSGNDNLVYDASRTYLASSLLLNKISGISISNIGNTELQWETTKRFNAGFELNAVHNRIGLQFNYFHSWTDNLLTLQELGFVSGLDYNWSNGGSLKNQGFDVSASALLVSHKDWNWTVGASLGHYVNELTALPDNKTYMDTEIYGATIRSQIGRSVNSFYGYKTEGVYASSEEAAKAGLYIVDETGAKTYFGAGDVKFVDLNGDGKIDESDRTFIGDANPDIYGNIFTSVIWKNLTLDVCFNYSLGGDVFNYMRQQLESGSRFMNQTTAMLNRWTTEGQVTDIPKATYNDPMGNSRFSDRWIEDGSYLRLKTVTLSYKLPISNTYIQGLTVWAQCNNLFTVTKYLGTDPEFSLSNSPLYQGIDAGLLSQGRSFHIGVKINL
ncbi:MAG: SusC/RagA family TonB-linked outer membrane protein [Prevotellaceae bacterium]|nr:SusC/RagA family TonB-linked outer membrane protein [Prevotellaceae bacterium]